jgi:AAA15 family ATPase/GTPase
LHYLTVHISTTPTMALSLFGFQNFRGFKEKTILNLAPISVLTGPNSSGKSSVLKGMLLLQDSLSDGQLKFAGGSHNLGSFNLARNLGSNDDYLRFSFDHKSYVCELTYSKSKNLNMDQAYLSGILIFHKGTNTPIIKCVEHQQPEVYLDDHSNYGDFYSYDVFIDRQETLDLLIRKDLALTYYYYFSLYLGHINKCRKYTKPQLLASFNEFDDFLSQVMSETIPDEMARDQLLLALRSNAEYQHLFNEMASKAETQAEAFPDGVDDAYLEQSFPYGIKSCFFLELTTNFSEAPYLSDSSADVSMINYILHSAKADTMDYFNIATSFDLVQSLYLEYLRLPAKELICKDIEWGGNGKLNLDIKILTQRDRLAIKELSRDGMSLEFFNEMPVFKYLLSKIEDFKGDESDLLRSLLIGRFKPLRVEDTYFDRVVDVIDPLAGHAQGILKACVKEFYNSLSQNGFKHLDAVRANTKRLYTYQGQGTAFNELLIDYKKAYIDDKMKRFLNKWLQEFKLGKELSVTADEYGVGMVVKVDDMLLADFGYGYTQFLPILMRIAIMNGQILYIEEPETNLHPKLQSKLADLFVDAHKTFNIQFIIETHSEYFIRKLQYLTARKEIQTTDTVIHYFYDVHEERPAGTPQVKEINIQPDGRLNGEFGAGFYDETARLMMAIMTGENLN